MDAAKPDAERPVLDVPLSGEALEAGLDNDDDDDDDDEGTDKPGRDEFDGRDGADDVAAVAEGVDAAPAPDEEPPADGELDEDKEFIAGAASASAESPDDETGGEDEVVDDGTADSPDELADEAGELGYEEEEDDDDEAVVAEDDGEEEDDEGV